MFTTPEPIFYKAIDSHAESHTAQYIFKILSEAIEEVGPEKVHAMVSDNAPNMKAAWGLLKEKYPHLIVYGCAAHGLNLLAKDIAQLPIFSKVLAKTKKIVQTFKNKHIPASVLRAIQQDRAGMQLALSVPIETRWGTFNKCLESVFINKSYLRAAVIEETVTGHVDERVRADILDDKEFWPSIEKSIAVLKPISTAITTLESDSDSFANITKMMKLLDDSLTKAIVEFSSETQKIIKELFIKRQNFINHDGHLSASAITIVK